MATVKDRYICSVCKALYKEPVVHRLCGYSFDRQCIGKICPADGCGRAVIESDLIVNYDLLSIVDEYRVKIEVPAAYYLFLLDASTSMWYSDTRLPFLTGESRFTLAKQFLNQFFQSKKNSVLEKVSLITFDTSPLQIIDFETIDETHLAVLENLTCDGKDTALFDSIEFCLNKVEQTKRLHGNTILKPYLLIITDGGNNFGKTESDQAIQLSYRSKKLDISGHIIQIGAKDRKKSKTICERIKFKYNYFTGGNVTEAVNSLVDSISLENQTQIRARTEPVNQMVNRLPSVPDSPVRVPTRLAELA